MSRLVTIIFFLCCAWQTAVAQACKPLTDADFPPADRPGAAEADRLGGKNAYRFYYGIGGPVDYVQARKAAFAEWRVWLMDHDPYSGVDILMMIYANGYGVKRNLDLSIRLACGNVGGTEQEFMARINHLLRMKEGDSTGIFDLADDITSTYMLEWRAGIQSKRDSAVRAPVLDSLIARWPPSALPAYRAARKAAGSFFEARIGKEIEHSGSLALVYAIGESDSLEKSFLIHLLEGSHCFTGTAAGSLTRKPDSSDAEKELGSIYLKRMLEQDDRKSSIKKKNIRSTQKRWQAYRDAMLRLDEEICPGGSLEAADRLTRERSEQLLQLLQAL